MRKTTMAHALLAGASQADITPLTPQHLFGYPHVERQSTGTHDPLLSSALYLGDGDQQVMFITNDTVVIGKSTALRVRDRIAAATGVPAGNVLVSATHTHSGPLAEEYTRRETETDTPDPDPQYLQLLEDGILKAALAAYRGRQPAEAGLSIADARGIGTHRHDPAGPSNLNVPVLAVRRSVDHAYIAAMLICWMHPTVLHEDSSLVSADFPGMARQYLQRNVLGAQCPVLHHAGPCGNQSPRHVTRGNTFEEAVRLGEILGKAVERTLANIAFTTDLPLSCTSLCIDLPRRDPGNPIDAERKRAKAQQRLAELRRNGAPRAEVRTAECDLFGAEEAYALARSAADGRLKPVFRTILPAEVQLITVGCWSFVGWPCEIFVEFGLQVQARYPNAFVISLANGELRGYVVTQQAADEGWYEAGNSLVKSPEAGNQLVEATLKLLNSGR